MQSAAAFITFYVKQEVERAEMAPFQYRHRFRKAAARAKEISPQAKKSQRSSLPAPAPPAAVICVHARSAVKILAHPDSGTGLACCFGSFIVKLSRRICCDINILTV
jgi:hypothetical protein